MAQLTQAKDPELLPPIEVKGLLASWSGLMCELQAKERPCLK